MLCYFFVLLFTFVFVSKLTPNLSFHTAELEAQYLEAQNRKKRMESLEAKVKWYEDRLKKEEDPIPLDVTLPKWGSPFAQTLSVRKLEISSGSVDLLTAPVSTFEDLEFVGFSPAESIMCGSLRSNPFGKFVFCFCFLFFVFCFLFFVFCFLFFCFVFCYFIFLFLIIFCLFLFVLEALSAIVTLLNFRKRDML